MLKRLATSAWRLFNLSTNRLTLVAGDIAGVGVLVMSLAIAMDVTLRYAFNAPTIWVNEASSYMLLVIAFLGLAYALRENAHIRIDVVVKRLPRQVQDWMRVINSTLFLILIIILFYFTWGFFTESLEFGTTSRTGWDIPLAPWQVFTPLGLAIIGLLLICNLYTEIKIARGKSQEHHKESS